MKRFLMAAGLSLSMFACENGMMSHDQADKTTESDVAKTRDNAHKTMATAQQDADKRIIKDGQDAAKAQDEADKKIARAQDDIVNKKKDLRAQNGDLVNVSGQVKVLRQNDLDLRTTAGKTLTLQFSDDTGNAMPVPENIKEGDQIRAAYDLVDGADVVRDIHVVTK